MQGAAHSGGGALYALGMINAVVAMVDWWKGIWGRRWVSEWEGRTSKLSMICAQNQLLLAKWLWTLSLLAPLTPRVQRDAHLRTGDTTQENHSCFAVSVGFIYYGCRAEAYETIQMLLAEKAHSPLLG